MRKFIDLTKWFYIESMSYMEGHSKWHIYTRMPKSYIRFMYFTYFGDGLNLREYYNKTFNTKER